MARKGSDGPGADFAARMVMEDATANCTLKANSVSKTSLMRSRDAVMISGRLYRYSAFDCSCVTIVANEYPLRHSYPLDGPQRARQNASSG